MSGDNKIKGVPGYTFDLEEWEALGASWELSLRADGYAANTLRAYRQALASFTSWLSETPVRKSPQRGENLTPDLTENLTPAVLSETGKIRFPIDVTRAEVRGWLAHVRETNAPGTCRGWFAGIRHFFRWAVAEDEIEQDPTAGIRTPSAGDPVTPVLSLEDLRALFAACAGKSFTARRDMAVCRLLADGGLRIAELAGLTVADIDLRERLVYVKGKGSRRSGPRHRAVPVGVKTMQSLDRYLRERRRHPHAASEALWLGSRNRGPMSQDGVVRILTRRAAEAGLKGVHPHQLRHTWAHQFRDSGGSEGDLMVLGGWRSRQMLDRYGAAAAAGRAADAYRRLSLGDRL